jgi:hypothetical protein
MDQPERRRHRRLSMDKVRVRLVSGQFENLSGTVNFAKRLLNVGLGGACIETTGRLRPDVAMTVEIRFDEFGGNLRSAAQVIWTETVGDKGLETHLMGLKFIGLEISNAVRDYFDGGRASAIISKRRAEYEVLKEKAEARKANVGTPKWSAKKKMLVSALVLVLLYVGSFGGLVAAGRTESAAPGIHYRYLGGDDVEGALAKLYSPAYWAARKAGLDLTCDRP